MTWGYWDQTKGRNILGGNMCEDMTADTGLDLGAEFRRLIKSGVLYVSAGRRNEWIGGEMEKWIWMYA